MVELTQKAAYVYLSFHLPETSNVVIVLLRWKRNLIIQQFHRRDSIGLYIYPITSHFQPFSDCGTRSRGLQYN